MDYKFFSYFFFLGVILLSAGCSSQADKQEVVIYTSVDQVYSSKIFKQFEKQSGISVKAVYDAEANKAVGLEHRLLAEKNSPRADVFWNSEFMRTARLAGEGIFDAYTPQNITYSNPNHISPAKEWYGLGLRARVFIINKEKLTPQEYPSKLSDLLAPRFKGRVAMAVPFSGSTSTHFAALYHRLGKERFVQFLKQLKANQVALLAGNSVVKDAVGNGRYLFGLVDSDDALVGVEQDLPVELVYYDQNDKGPFSLFQTVALVKGGPNPSNAKKLIEYLLSEQTEKQLIAMNGVQFPIIATPEPKKIPTVWTSSADSIADSLQPSIQLMRKYLD